MVNKQPLSHSTWLLRIIWNRCASCGVQPFTHFTEILMIHCCMQYPLLRLWPEEPGEEFSGSIWVRTALAYSVDQGVVYSPETCAIIIRLLSIIVGLRSLQLQASCNHHNASSPCWWFRQLSMCTEECQHAPDVIHLQLHASAIGLACHIKLDATYACA